MDIELYQQGDVLFFKQDSDLPKNAELVTGTGSPVVFAESEATGHTHATSSHGVTLYKVGEDQDQYCIVEDTAEVTHQEHNTVILPKGVYRVDIVKEIDPFTKEIERVRD